MTKPISSKFVTRQMIAGKMGVTSKTIKRYIDKYKNDILMLDPLFTDRDLISPKISRFLFEKFTGNTFNDQDDE